MPSWSTFKTREKWSNISNKPIILADNQISWNEILGVPLNPGNWQPWVLSSFYGQYLEWMPLTPAANPFTMVQRDGSGRIRGNSFVAESMPSSSLNLGAGHFYRDSNGFIKIVL